MVPPSEFAQALPDMPDLVHAFGVRTGPGATGLTVGLTMGLGERGAIYRSLIVAMGAEMEPTDMIEAMLVQQIALTYSTMTRASGKSWDANSLEVVEAWDRITNRAARTFAAQVEALRRYRAGGDPAVHVGRVTVNDGGQAIVGNVGRGRRQDEK